MDKKLSQQIIEMKKIDQDLRFKAKPGTDVFNYLIYVVDAIHNYRLKKIINQYGYPNKKLIGTKGMESFWLLIQHQDYDVELQQNCLNNCDFNKKSKAYLIDRINVNKGEPQIYGTQFYSDKNGKILPRPIKNRRNLKKRRRKAGLEPFNVNKKRLLEMNKKINRS